MKGFDNLMLILESILMAKYRDKTAEVRDAVVNHPDRVDKLIDELQDGAECIKNIAVYQAKQI
jgi:hypothetical protein